MTTRRFVTGEVVNMREVHEGTTWALRPMRVVRDDDEMLAVWLPRGTPWWKPVTLDGRPWRVPLSPWKLIEDVWGRFDILQLIERDPEGYLPYAIWHSWSDDGFVGWYVNLQAPLRRVEDGFEYLDHALDLIVNPDLTHRWKDEDELADYVLRGILTEEAVAEVRAVGEAVLARARRREPPFDESWVSFRPDPTWTLPTRPAL